LRAAHRLHHGGPQPSKEILSMRPSIKLSVAATAAWLAGASVAALADPASQATTRAPRWASRADVAVSDGVNLCSGGLDSPLGASLDAVAIHVDRRGESLELALAVAPTWPRGGRVRWAVELVDDLGHAVHAPRTAPIRALAAGGVADARLDIPAGLADGFYVARVTVVGTDGAQPGSDLLEAHVEVTDGTITLHEASDWYVRSRANQAVRP
jgi:hypothetical protein